MRIFGRDLSAKRRHQYGAAEMQIDKRNYSDESLMGRRATGSRGTNAARHDRAAFEAAAALRFHQRWRLLVGVSAPAVPPITAPAPAPRPPPRIAPAAAPPPAPMPTFLARLRLPLLLLLLFLLEVVRLLEVAAITGKAVSPSSPRHRTTAHSDFFIDRPSRNKICNRSARAQIWSSTAAPPAVAGLAPAIGRVPQRTVAEPSCTILCHGDSQNLMRPLQAWLHRKTGCFAAFHCCGCLFMQVVEVLLLVGRQAAALAR